jgi:hypothetical protein
VRGDTDILLNVPGGAVLVAECHKWDGPGLYAAKLEQLFDYVAWRHTAAVMITFSGRESLTAVIQKADGAITSHSSYRRGFESKTSTYRVSSHAHPSDEQKAVEIHHLFFNLRARSTAGGRPAGTARRRTVGHAGGPQQ